MSDLREALERTLDVYAAISDPEVADAEAEVRNAARRFLALTETGPDYERADAAFRIALATKGIEVEGLPTAEVSRAIVDAALADYLTEEE